MSRIIDERWQVEKPLGEGGQAHTFLVKDRTNGSLAVLKRLKNPNRLPRFRQEVAAIASLDNPFVLKLIHANTEADKPYLVSEYCALGSMQDQWRALSEMSVDQRLWLASQIAEGTTAAHRAGIVHRDLKPSNIFLRNLEEAVIGDFGVCFVKSTERLTPTEEAVGARYYMAPELAEGRAEEITPQADIYSIGKIIYWLLTGKTFDREYHRRKDLLLTNYYEQDSILHVHQLLDIIVQYEPSSRVLDAPLLCMHLTRLRNLLAGGYPTLEHPPRRCRYCGVGNYRRLGASNETHKVMEFGLQPGFSVPNIFICSNCGHVEMFRPSYSSHPHWLEPGPR